MIRLNGLDGLRGLLAITVMMSHLVGSFIGWTDDRAFIGAYLSVVYFFMMSGFVLSYSHNNDTNFLKYALIRLARLLPLHIITTLIIVLIFKYNSTVGAYVPNEEVFSIKTILKNILFLNGVYSANHSRVDIVYMLFFIPLLFIDFTNEEFWLRKLLSNNFFLFLGFISFPLYLLHDLVIVSGLAKHDNVFLSMLIAGFISISLAFLYARCIDIYLYKKMKLIINRMF